MSEPVCMCDAANYGFDGVWCSVHPNPTAPTPADVPGQGEVALSEAWRALDNALIYLWSTTGSRRGNNGRQGQLDYGMRNAHAAVERILAARIAAAEQRGREDNADHGMCYVHGSKALAERDAEVARAAWEAALDHVWELADPADTVVQMRATCLVVTQGDVVQAKRENPHATEPRA